MDCIESNQPEGQAQTRRELRAGTQYVNLPTIQLDYIAQYWHELGCVRSGSHPLTWSDIAAFSQITGLELKPFEAQALISMSCSYLAQLSRTDQAEAAPVFTDNRTPEQRTADLQAKFRRAGK